MMLQRINYGDNIFYLTMLIRVMRDSEKLQIDPGLFINKLKEDILLVYRSVETIYDNLKDSSLIKGRGEYFRDISRLAEQFIGFLMSVVSEKTSFSTALKGEFAEYRRIIQDLERSQKEVSDILAGISKEVQDGEYTISEEEYRILLADEDDK